MADKGAKRLAELIEPLRVTLSSNVTLPKDYPAYKGGWLKKESKEHLRLSVELLAQYQDRLAAQETHGVLVVLQALDAAGKDGTIRHVMSGLNPQASSRGAAQAVSKRIDVAEKNWKISASDVNERAHWDESRRAFSEMLTHTSTDWAPGM